jgi:hypothetical protein
MRTFAARRTAASAFATTTHAMVHYRFVRDDQHVLLTALSSRPGWARRTGREFVHTFGGRRAEITAPAQLQAPVLAALITRAEINTLLGDCEWTLLAELQALATRELQHLCASSASSGM